MPNMPLIGEMKADHKSCWEITWKTSPSGKALHRCTICGRLSVSPNRECFRSPAVQAEFNDQWANRFVVKE
jgi:hypothetical protein